MQTVTIADCGFLLTGTRSAFIGGENVGVGPSHFEWERTDPLTARLVTDAFISHARGQGQVAWLIEPFFLHPGNYTAALDGDFDFVLTHDDTFVANRENWLWYPAGGSWIAFDRWGIRPKTRNISMLLSNKRMTRGHRMRHEIIAAYGKMLDAVMGLDKRVTTFEALADFRYSVIVENEKSRYWFTEKLIDALSVGTIPIYWGCPDIGRFFDSRGVIEFDDLADLGNILAWLKQPGVADEDYARRLPAAQNNLEVAKRYRVCEDWIFDHYPHLFGAGQ